MTYSSVTLKHGYRQVSFAQSQQVVSGSFRNVMTLFALVACYGGATLLMFTLGYMELPPPLSAVRYLLVGCGLGTIIFLGITEKKKVEYRANSRILLAIWGLFSLMNVVAAIAIGDAIYSTLTECWLLLGVPFLFYYLLPRSAIGHVHRNNINAVIIVTTAYLLYSLYDSPNLHFLYRGSFGHANSVGVLGSTLGVGCMGVLLSNHRGGRKLKLIGVITIFLLLGLAMSAILISGSRTALLGFAGASVMGIFFVRRSIRRLLIFLALVSGLFATFLSVGTETGVPWIDAILQKHQNQSRTGDVLSGRTVIWETILADARPFGNGSNYFAYNVGVSAHNTFLNALGQRGIVACLLLIVFAILALIFTFRYTLMSYTVEPEMIGSFLLIVHFWILSMAESTLSSLGTVVSLSFYAAFGSMITQSRDLKVRPKRAILS